MGMLYASQSEDYGNRLITKKNKIQDKLDGKSFYKKPHTTRIIS